MWITDYKYKYTNEFVLQVLLEGVDEATTIAFWFTFGVRHFPARAAVRKDDRSPPHDMSGWLGNLGKVSEKLKEQAANLAPIADKLGSQVTT